MAGDGTPLGLPAPTYSVADPARTALGRKVFFDRGLSRNAAMSCATCHQPQRAFTDGRSQAEGVDGQLGARNTPSLFNVGYLGTLFWDGRRTTLEELVLDPFLNPLEHGLANVQDLLGRLRANRSYVQQFSHAFPGAKEPISKENVSLVLAAYVRSLSSANSPFDHYLYAEQKDALSPAAIRGLELFRGRAGCAECHLIGEQSALLTDEKFHSLGVGLEPLRPKLGALTRRAASLSDPIDHAVIQDPELAELGRFLVTQNPQDIGKFRTPSLRNVALTAPYMHNGRIATLEDAIEQEVYYRNLTSDRPLVLTPAEKNELVEFLRSLTDFSATNSSRN